LHPSQPADNLLLQGCAVSLVKEGYLPVVMDAIGKTYREKIGYEPTFYIAETGDGPSRIG
jgi:galactokinase